MILCVVENAVDDSLHFLPVRRGNGPQASHKGTGISAIGWFDRRDRPEVVLADILIKAPSGPVPMPGKATPKAKSTTATGTKSKGWTDEERAAMKERAKELKAGADKADGESAVLAKIAEMSEPDRAMGKRLHAIIKANAPILSPRIWYGMPAYAKDGKVVCHFQDAAKFKTRYATLGFSDAANLDDGHLWPVAFALKELTTTEEARISAFVKKAVS